MAKTKKKFNISGLKNWLVLGAAAFGGYYVYEHYVKGELKDLKADAKDLGKKKPGVMDPDLNGPAVTKFELASTRSRVCISVADPRFVYAPVGSVNSMTGYQTFTSPVSGHFTRRMLCKGGKSWVEIRPA